MDYRYTKKESVMLHMETALNFRTQKGREDYIKAYEKTLRLWDVEYSEKCVTTSFGGSYCLVCGSRSNPPLVLLHAASCGSTIWYPNIKALSQSYCVYAIDLITEPSKSSLIKPIKGREQCAGWLEETLNGLGLGKIYLCGLSIGGWNAANYSSFYPLRVIKLILLSPVQTFARMHTLYFFKIMKMGFNPTRKNVEEYLGWGGGKEAPLPDSIIEQFTISALNINPNGVFPKMMKKKTLKDLKMPVLAMFGENEFAFNVKKAIKTAKSMIGDLETGTVKNVSHLISIGSSKYINERLIDFLSK
jgi:pimeloyl-ACP methyl ester carboxylesterase